MCFPLMSRQKQNLLRTSRSHIGADLPCGTINPATHAVTCRVKKVDRGMDDISIWLSKDLFRAFALPS